MINATRPILNLDPDLLRAFVAVADLNTSAAAAVAVCRTQSAVSQQMQRLERLVGKELFARHGRDKLLTEQGIQLLGYTRKILRSNDEACISLMCGSLQGGLTIGTSKETADTILPFLLNRIGCFCSRMTLKIKVHPHAAIMAMLVEGRVDLALTIHQPPGFTSFIPRTSPAPWYYAAEYVLAKGESIPLILLEEPGPLRQDIVTALETAHVPWHLAHGASSLSRVEAAIKTGLGVTTRPVEMMNPDLRAAGISDGLPGLPDTRYVVSCNPQTVSELPQVIFQSLSQKSNPWRTGPALTPQEGDDTSIL